MTSEALTAIVQRTLLQSLQRHATSNYGTIVDVPGTVERGRYDKMTGYFMLTEVAMDIAAAVEAALPKPCECPK